jgi:hypothetical protein
MCMLSLIHFEWFHAYSSHSFFWARVTTGDVAMENPSDCNRVFVARTAKSGTVTNGHFCPLARASDTIVTWKVSNATSVFSMDRPMPSKTLPTSP